MKAARKQKDKKREYDEKGVDEKGEKVPGGFHLCRATYTPADCNVGNAPLYQFTHQHQHQQHLQQQQHQQQKQTAMLAIRHLVIIILLNSSETF